MKFYLYLAAVCCIFLVGCSSSDSSTPNNSEGSVDSFTVPAELLGTWQLSCMGDETTGYQVQTIEFTAAVTTYTAEKYTDDVCQAEDTTDPISSSSGAAEFGDLITTTNGVEAREWDHINDMFNNMILDPTITSYNIYYIQNDVLFNSGGATTEENRPDTLDFTEEWIKQ